MIVNDVFLEAKSDFVGMQNSDHTKRAYANDIRHWEQFIQHVTMDEPIASMAVAFKTALEDKYAPATAQRIWCTVAAFYGWMKGTGRITGTPFLGIKSPKRPSEQPPAVPTDDQIARLLHATENGSTHGDRSRLIMELLLNGLRAQEVCNARLEGFMYDKDTQAWVLSVLGKGDKYRTIPLNSGAQQAIYNFYENNYDQSEWLVPNRSGAQMTTQTVYRAVKYYGKQAGFEDLHPHALRHHYATRLVRNGVDVFTLQKLLGHERADTTQRYIALDNTDIVKALNHDPMHDKFKSHTSFNIKSLQLGTKEITW